MFLNLRDVFSREYRCIPAFNFYNLETLKAILNGAKAEKREVIASFGEGYLHHMNLETVVSLSKALKEELNISFVLHLDHAKNIDIIKMAIRAGFSSVMYDGSHLPLSENISNTKEIVNFARKYNVSVEGELGSLNVEDGNGEVMGTNFYTSIDDAEIFVRSTSVDALAISVGNAHGKYKGVPHIDIDRVRDIYLNTKVPLVLHGCSGIDFESVNKAIQSGVRKININTDLSFLASASAYNELLINNGEVRFEKVMEKAQHSMEEKVKEYLKQYSCFK